MMQSYDQISIINLDTRMHEAYIPKTAFRTHSCVSLRIESNAHKGTSHFWRNDIWKLQ
jgi:hypothetical protein